jgi:hypothetical protein
MILTPEEDEPDSNGDPPCRTAVPTAVLPKKNRQANTSEAGRGEFDQGFVSRALETGGPDR